MSVHEMIRDAAACLTCGEEHKPIPHPTNPIHAPSWAHPKDGHAYRLPAVSLQWMRDWAQQHRRGTTPA